MEIRAFRGWHYATDDVSSLIAPPYDVLGQADKDALEGRDGRNIVRVDLPHLPADGSGPEQAYASAGRTLRRWQGDGTMTRQDRPALYAYQQSFEWAGASHVRRAMICAVRATDLGRDVIPHERTFAGPQADRLRLTQHTRAQMSPIFGFYEGGSAGAAGALWEAARGAAEQRGTLDGVAGTLRAVTDPGAIRAVARSLRDVPVFIADGHHRYVTAMSYRDRLGEIPPDHPANFVMFALVARDDSGLVVLPTHRLIRRLAGFDLDRFVAATGDVMEWRRVHPGAADLADAGAYLRGFGPGAMAFVAPPAAGERAPRAYVGRLTDPAAMAAAAPQRSRAWRELDVAILHELLIGRHLSPGSGQGPAVEYTPDAPAALARAAAGRADLVVLLQAIPLKAVAEIAGGGEFMPHKSTYFYPKLATGMVLYPLEAP